MTKFWKIKRKIGLFFVIVLIGGLFAILFSISQKNRAIVYYHEGKYDFSIERYSTLTGGNLIEDVLYTDFNEDAILEKIVLNNGIVTVEKEVEEVLRTDPKWDVHQFLVGDFNNDGSKDLGIYLWKIGNYGPSMPFWVEENDDSFRQHLFLYAWRDNRLKPLWHSSNLPYENIKTILADVDNDGQNEIIVLEKPYDLKSDYALNVAVWRWDEWGFTNIWRSGNGKFHDLKVI